MRTLPLLIGLVIVSTAAASAFAAEATPQVQFQIRKYPAEPGLLRMLGLPDAGIAARDGRTVSVGEKALFVLLHGPVQSVESAKMIAQDDGPADVETVNGADRRTLTLIPSVRSTSSANVTITFAREFEGRPVGKPFRGNHVLKVGETLAAVPEPGSILVVTLLEVEPPP